MPNNEWSNSWISGKPKNWNLLKRFDDATQREPCLLLSRESDNYPRFLLILYNELYETGLETFPVIFCVAYVNQVCISQKSVCSSFKGKQ